MWKEKKYMAHRLFFEAIFLIAEFNKILRINQGFALPAAKLHPLSKDAKIPLMECH